MVNNIIFSLIIIVIIQYAFFVIAYAFQTDKFTDLVYGSTFAGFSATLLLLNPQIDIVKIIAALMVIIWGIRLAGYLFYRITKKGKDDRFDKMRKKPLNFFGFWTLQAITIWVVLLPVLIILNNQNQMDFNIFSIAGVVIWLTGLSVESIADSQKFKFKMIPENKTKFISSGLWNRSRHPNYFGEILVWVGVYLFALPYLEGVELLSIISPIYIAVLLIRISGIPLLERKYDEKYKDDKDYQKYKKDVPVLLPRIL